MRSKNRKTVIIVGAGISGLTAGAYVLRSGFDVLILEKASECGGLINSFKDRGFLFDTGPRAIGNAGILVPMLEDLGIDLPLVDNPVSTGIEDHIVQHDTKENINDFLLSLHKLFPEAGNEIRKIARHIRAKTRMVAILNRVANPFFKNIPRDWRYLFTEFLPWLPSFFSVVFRTSLFNKSIEEVLGAISANQSLNDMVSQYFFKGTPANFAFGYFENFQDYKYPLGGTGLLPDSLAQRIVSEGGLVQTNTEVLKIDAVAQTVTDQNGAEYTYDFLLWAADLKTLYQHTEYDKCSNRIQNTVRREQQKYLSGIAGESVFTVFLAVDESPNVFGKVSKGHFIYTPNPKGLGQIHRKQLEQLKAKFPRIEKQELFHWLKDFCLYNSYEISIPVLKDESSAPAGKTGLIISLLVDGELFQLLEQAGWYGEFREKTTEYMLEVLDDTIYPGLKDKILFSKSATPITLSNRFNSENGAITGWSLEEKSPVPNSLAGITATVKTSLPRIYKSGQWSYSPSGVPIAILTGRIAARAIQKDARKL